MLTSCPRAAAPVAMTKAARTLSSSPEKTTSATLSSGRLSSTCSDSLLEGAQLLLQRLQGDGLVCRWSHHLQTSRSPSAGLLDEVDVDLVTVLALGLLRQQLHVLGDLGPALEVLDGSSVRAQDSQHLAIVELADLLAGLDTGIGQFRPLVSRVSSKCTSFMIFSLRWLDSAIRWNCVRQSIFAALLYVHLG